VRCIFIFYFLFLIVVSSCTKKFDFGYNCDKAAYMANVNCFRENYSSIYDSLNPTPSIYFSPSSVTKHAVCGELYSVMQRHKVDFVNFERDSTVAFYSGVQKGKQFILIFITGRINIHDKITTDIKILDKKDNNCYELEKEISLAN
jgi:hypothetical protein